MSKKENVVLVNRIILLPINNWNTTIKAIGEIFNIPDSSVMKMISDYIVQGDKIESASDLKQVLLKEYSKKSGYDLTLDIVSFYFNIDREKIMLPRNKGLCGYSKQLAIFFMYYHNQMSRKEIADVFSIKNTTVRYSIKKVRKYIDLPIYKKDVKAISEQLGAKNIYYKLLAKNLHGNKK